MPEDNKAIFTASQIFLWFQKSSLVILDQTLFSGGNFLVSILLARWLTPVQYGAYAVAFSIFLLLTTFHTALFIEPMLVFGAGKYNNNFQRYLAILLYGNIIAVIPFSIILVVISLFLGKYHSIEVQKAILGLVIAGPIILFLLTLRRAFYVRFRPIFSVIGVGVYILILIIFIYVMKTYNMLSQSTAFLGMGLSSFIISVSFIYRLRPKWVGSHDITLNAVADVHWRYGKWALASAVMVWIPSNIYFIVLPLWIGLNGAAILKVVMNIGNIAFLSNGALALFLIPLFSKYAAESKNKMISVMKFFFALFIIGNICYFLILTYFPREILNLFYGKRYEEFYYLIPLVGFLAIPNSVGSVFASALRAMELPSRVFLYVMTSVLVTFVIGIPLATIMGITGVILGTFLSFSISALAILFFLHKEIYNWGKP